MQSNPAIEPNKHIKGSENP